MNRTRKTIPKVSTRQAILDAAVRHFAEQGFSGASLREIMRDAQVNIASAHYHFGSKEILYRETIDRHLSRLCDERLATLDQLEQTASSKKPLRIEELVRAYVEPHIRLCKDPGAQHYVRLLSRFITENDQVTGVYFTEILAPVRQRYLQALGQCMPDVNYAALTRLFSFMVALMVTAPADPAYKSLTGHSAWPTHPEDLIDSIVAFVTAGLINAQKNAVRVKPEKSRAARKRALSASK